MPQLQLSCEASFDTLASTLITYNVPYVRVDSNTIHVKGHLDLLAPVFNTSTNATGELGTPSPRSSQVHECVRGAWGALAAGGIVAACRMGSQGVEWRLDLVCRVPACMHTCAMCCTAQLARQPLAQSEPANDGHPQCSGQGCGGCGLLPSSTEVTENVYCARLAGPELSVIENSNEGHQYP